MLSASHTTRTGQQDPGGFLAIVVLTQLFGFSSLIVSPLLVGGLMTTHGFSAERAGLFATIGLMGLAGGSLLASMLVNRVPRRPLAVATTLIASGCFLAMTLDLTMPMLIALQLFAGLASGAVLSTSTAIGATSCDPEKLFARVTIYAGLVGAAFTYVAGMAGAVMGMAGVLAAEGALGAVCVATMMAFNARVMELQVDHDGKASALPSVPWPLIAATLTAAVLLYASWQGLWTFAERIGSQAGLSTGVIGFVLGTSTFLGIVSAIVCVWAIKFRGRVFSALVFCTATCVAGFFFVYHQHWLVFAIACAAWGALNFFATPLLYGLAAWLGGGGKWAGATSGFGLLGAAMGPALAGQLSANFGFAGAGWLGIGLAIAGTAAMIPVCRWVDRRAPKDAELIVASPEVPVTT